MSEKREQIFVPGCYVNAKTLQWGTVIQLSFRVKDLIAFAEQHKTDKDFLRLEIVPKRNPTEKSSHFCRLDTYVPKAQQQPTEQRPTQRMPQGARNEVRVEPQEHFNYDPNDDVPF